jgi:hypothetical protein
MWTFWQWLRLLTEERQDLVPAAVLRSYDTELKRQLSDLIARTKDPALRRKFQDMLDCPIRDSRGNCRGFAEYVVAALVRNGIHRRFDLEAALNYIIEKMLLDRSDTGQPRSSLFGGFEERPYTAGNPLQARFFRFLELAIGNIRKGKIVRLSPAQLVRSASASAAVRTTRPVEFRQKNLRHRLPANRTSAISSPT